MTIKINELDELYKFTIKSLKQSGFEEFEINSDYYWMTDADERENMGQKPKLLVGSLIDDYESLKKLIEKIQPLTIVDLERMGNLLISISAMAAKSNKILTSD